ncbi:hypothetical protein [Microseira wollei]|nr:hypothetical protein [Microseira wollei]
MRAGKQNLLDLISSYTMLNRKFLHKLIFPDNFIQLHSIQTGIFAVMLAQRDRKLDDKAEQAIAPLAGDRDMPRASFANASYPLRGGFI